MACKSSSQSTFTPTFPSESTQPVASSSTSSMPNPSLITPGSVFVFDEQESGIYRWTDGKIWSPSRICGNFLVYRELYRKLPNQKCLTTSDKDKMKDGSGLIDRALREKVEEENMVVMGCTKGTFVLKKDGLIKKTICVKGINLLPPEELKKRLEVLPISMSRHNGSSNRGSGRRVANEQKPLPGLSIKGTTQHLVCYEKPGEMQGLHSPRDYIELRDLPISKTFVTIQSYRIPIKILPLESNQQPLDLADEYIHSSRIVEARNSKLPWLKFIMAMQPGAKIDRSVCNPIQILIAIRHHP
ncbi:hypothetical protein FBU30_008279 [Linnemannia zychae]|nr:hypothetical protein FBU30_008279 [Linnemannia zychae]